MASESTRSVNPSAARAAAAAAAHTAAAAAETAETLAHHGSVATLPVPHDATLRTASLVDGLVDGARG